MDTQSTVKFDDVSVEVEELARFSAFIRRAMPKGTTTEEIFRETVRLVRLGINAPAPIVPPLAGNYIRQEL